MSGFVHRLRQELVRVARRERVLAEFAPWRRAAHRHRQWRGSAFWGFVIVAGAMAYFTDWIGR